MECHRPVHRPPLWYPICSRSSQMIIISVTIIIIIISRSASFFWSAVPDVSAVPTFYKVIILANRLAMTHAGTHLQTSP